MRKYLSPNFFISANLLRTKLVNNFSTLVTVKSKAIEEMAKEAHDLGLPPRLIYSPTLVLNGEAALRAEIHRIKPTILMVGADKIGSDSLHAWREIISQEKLTIIRRGTSLAAIDVKTAKALGIEVLNTPHVNSAEVAKNAYNILCAMARPQSKQSRLGIIGFGHIGRRLAMEALKSNRTVCAYSPGLLAAWQKYKNEFNGFDLSKIKVASSIEEICAESNEIVIAAAMGQYHEGSIINAEAVRMLQPQTRMLCISEPEIFSETALAELARASELYATFDNSPYLMEKLKHKLITEVGGRKENFSFQSAMMSSPECQRDMDIAAIALLLKTTVSTKLPEIYRDLRECEFRIDNVGRKVRIVGAGISSMIAAFYFQENGYQVEIFEKDAQENPHGITRRAANARHLSYSETLTHATVKRIEDWMFSDITRNGSFFEKLFAEQFAVIGDNGPLVALLQSVVANLNKAAIKGESGWQDLQTKYPHIFSENIFGSGRILRLFSSEEELQKAYKFQSAIHDDEDGVKMIAANDLAEKLPSLRHLIESNEIAGAVEVVGYGVKIISLCQAIEQHLREQHGVNIGWGQEVQSDGERFFVRSQNGEKRELGQETPLVISSGVTPVLEQDRDVQKVYGLFISIPNCGLVEALKIHEKDPLGVINITPSDDGKLHISAGFQYFGSREASTEELQTLFSKLEKKVAAMFPQDYARAVESGEITRKFCPRPMTSHGLPKFSQFDGGVSFGGTNSGGTVQATILGQLALLQIEHDQGRFRENEALNEAVGEVLQVTRQCLNYLGSAIQPSSAIKPIATTRLRNHSEEALVAVG